MPSELSTISSSTISEFITLYQKEFGVCLSALEAKEILYDLLGLVEAIVKC